MRILRDGFKFSCISTIISWLSVFCKFRRFCRAVPVLKALLPAVEDRISNWEKLQRPTKKAKSLEKSDLVQFLPSSHSAENLLDKVYVTIGLNVTTVEIEPDPISLVISLSSQAAATFPTWKYGPQQWAVVLSGQEQLDKSAKICRKLTAMI